jgi:hypothetical protein
MDKKVLHLRTFFRTTTAVFDFANTVQTAIGGIVTPNKMHVLHRIALEEIEKENPDLFKIDNLLAEMEKLAESYNEPKPNFQKGGI